MISAVLLNFIHWFNFSHLLLNSRKKQVPPFWNTWNYLCSLSCTTCMRQRVGGKNSCLTNRYRPSAVSSVLACLDKSARTAGMILKRTSVASLLLSHRVWFPPWKRLDSKVTILMPFMYHAHCIHVREGWRTRLSLMQRRPSTMWNGHICSRCLITLALEIYFVLGSLQISSPIVWFLKPFNISRSYPQGGPLITLLFILIEPFAIVGGTYWHIFERVI